MTSKTLLGTIIKKYPYYTELLLKPHPYQEIFNMNHNWIGLIEFKKKTGTIYDVYHNYISSFITIHDENNTYQEHIEYFVVPSTITPVLVHPTWRKNNKKITSKEIPSTVFRVLSKKHPIDIIYSSHPF